MSGPLHINGDHYPTHIWLGEPDTTTVRISKEPGDLPDVAVSPALCGETYTENAATTDPRKWLALPVSDDATRYTSLADLVTDPHVCVPCLQFALTHAGRTDEFEMPPGDPDEMERDHTPHLTGDDDAAITEYDESYISFTGTVVQCDSTVTLDDGDMTLDIERGETERTHDYRLGQHITVLGILDADLDPPVLHATSTAAPDDAPDDEQRNTPITRGGHG